MVYDLETMKTQGLGNNQALGAFKLILTSLRVNTRQSSTGIQFKSWTRQLRGGCMKMCYNVLSCWNNQEDDDDEVFLLNDGTANANESRSELRQQQRNNFVNKLYSSYRTGADVGFKIGRWLGPILLYPIVAPIRGMIWAADSVNAITVRAQRRN